MPPWRSFAFLSVTFFMLLLDFSIVNVALPAIESAFGLPISTAQWVISTYAIALAGFLMLAGRCSDLYDRRVVFAIGLGLFTAASFVGGVSPNVAVLVAMRALQGLGAAIVTPSAMAILMEIFPSGDERNRALGLWNTVGSAGIAAGMLVGGVLVQYLGWRSVFFVNVPVGIAILALTPFVIPKDERVRPRMPLDLIGSACLTSGLVLLIFSIESVADRSADWDTWVELAFAVLLLVAFVLWERRAKSPLIPARLFRYENLVPGTINTFFEVAAYVAAFIFSSVLAQQGNHYSPLVTGLAFLPSSIAITAIAGPLSAPMVKRIGVRGVGFFGGISLMAGALILLLTRPGMPYWAGLLPGTVLIGFGGMWTYQAGVIAGLSAVATEDQGLASGLINASVQAASSIGVGLAAALSMAFGLPWAFVVSLVAAVLAFVTSTFFLRPISPESAPDRHYVPMGKAIAHRG
jgi:EmrB/QacA subfamily drug resistance transporter